MLSILILTHGNFGRELINSAQMIYGATENIDSVPLLPGASFEGYLDAVTAVLDQMPGETLILTDLYGGTPNNIAMMLQSKQGLDVLCGINLPVLIELMSLRESGAALDKIEDQLVATGKDSIRKVIPGDINESVF